MAKSVCLALIAMYSDSHTSIPFGPTEIQIHYVYVSSDLQICLKAIRELSELKSDCPGK